MTDRERMLKAESYLVITPKWNRWSKEHIDEVKISRVTQSIPSKLERGEIAIKISVKIAAGAFQPPKLVATLEIPADRIITGEALEIEVTEP